MIRLGIDTGGTFTDLLRLDAQGMKVHKVRSTPDDPARAIFAGISELMGDAEWTELIHGSTVATNALLERKGARVALVTTRGFEDVLEIGRQTRSELYNFMVKARRPLVPHGLIFGISERLNADGSVLEPLHESEVSQLVDALRAQAVDSVAVCLLHSYANPIHEDRLVKALEEAGFIVSASHKVLPEYREFERWSTTVVNAYVTPLMARYLSKLQDGLGRKPLKIMQSNGGSISAQRAKTAAVQTILSGPAAGVVGAQAVGNASGYSQLITFDMGGTSTDVSLINRAIGTTIESTVGDFPVRLPVLDIHTVGAGGPNRQHFARAHFPSERPISQETVTCFTDRADNVNRIDKRVVGAAHAIHARDGVRGAVERWAHQIVHGGVNDYKFFPAIRLGTDHASQ